MKNKEKISEFEDIVFEGRNKEYGAYALRSLYDKFVSISTTGAMLIFTLIVSYPLITAFFFPEENIKKENSDNGRIILIDFPTQAPIEKKDLPIPTTALPKTGMIKFLVPKIKPDELVKNEVIPTQEELVGKNPGTETVEGNENGRDLIIEVIEPQNPVNDVKVKEEVFTWAEEMPKFPGGDSELLSFFAKNIGYPELAKRAGVEGKVVLSFVVDKNGNVYDARVAKSIGAGCDEEALRVLKMMPQWTPGKQNGKPILTRIIIPVVFRLR